MSIVRPTDTYVTVDDTFKKWVDRINASLSFTDFSVDYDASSGLSLVIGTGKFTDGARVVTIPETTITLTPNSSLLVAINTAEGYEGITQYQQGSSSTPKSNIIPLLLLTTSATEITAMTDAKTWASVSGAGTATEGLIMINANIIRNQTVGGGKNAISVAPVISAGVEVTVEDGYSWVCL
jgi:hypothetical protein